MVLTPFEDFVSWEETFHLLRSPANAARLREVIEEFERGVCTERKLIE